MKANGFSLVEMLVVVAMFAFLGVVVSQSTIDTLRNTRKSDASVGVRENLELVVASMERPIRGAVSIEECTPTRIVYSDRDDIAHRFDCDMSGAVGFVAKADVDPVAPFNPTATPQTITSFEVDVIDCVFSCTAGGLGVSRAVSLSITAKDALLNDEEGSTVTVNTRINLRTD